MALLLPLLGAACSVPEAVNPVAIYDRITGETFARRTPPPGLDDPFPRLGTVPERPVRPELRAREAVSAALVQDREASRRALEPSEPAPPGLPSPGRAPGEPDVPGTPPPPPRLAAAPPIPWDATADSGLGPATPGAAPAAPSIEIGPAPPAPPPPDLLGPPRAP
ncbi:hypothetical protein M0638_07600 [Roseomonas sp. NAR14]|uniref:Uncharacterized protein n=1 Tax=Roseomonas acroporae TaxID=2937791 RepID=A0A9X1Y6W4_9PROT|nr:hypothetical protein [Roseomonas acroporae]MCK8784240.1 hypothetical protein [Roseomonas acroporae]